MAAMAKKAKTPRNRMPGSIAMTPIRIHIVFISIRTITLTVRLETRLARIQTIPVQCLVQVFLLHIHTANAYPAMACSRAAIQMLPDAEP